MIDIVSLIQSRGINLTKNYQHYFGKCPFDKGCKPDSLVVDAKDNTFLCESCDLVGDPVFFISKFDGVSTKHAKDLITNGGALVYQHKKEVVKKTTVTTLPCPLSADAEGEELLLEVVDYYHEHLLSHKPALDYLKKRGIYDEDLIKNFKIGFADRSLGLRLPSSSRVAGKKLRSNLVDIGIYRPTGHAHLNGCVVVPVLNDDRGINVYGRRIETRGSKVKTFHLNTNNTQPIFNSEALQNRELILCDTVINTLSFLSCGFENALCVVSDDMLSNDLLEEFKDYKIDSVHLALSATEEGEKQTLQVAEKLKLIGVNVYQIKYPWGMDANDLLVKKGKDALQEAQRNSLWLGGGTPETWVSEGVKTTTPNHLSEPKSPKVAQKTTIIKQVGDYHYIDLGDCSYRVGGLENNNNMSVMKVTLRVTCEGLIHIDNVDLYKDSDRRKFIDRANEECLLDKNLLKRDLGKILILLEEQMEQRIYHSEVDSNSTISISDEDREEALELLKSSDLLDRTLKAFDEIGLVGESTNKMTAFFVLVSRLLPKPLATVIQSSSASGKSALMDAVLSFFPDNQKLVLSSLTGQSLYYQQSLKHRILGISEDVGFERAGESLKLLQSQGYLSLSTSKNVNGKMTSEQYHVEGPISLIFTSTSCDLSEELVNRCVVLNLVEDESITQQIHSQQRMNRTLDGLIRKESKKKIQHIMQVAQLELKQYQVINSYAPDLTFTYSKSRTRRDHEKYLTLIDSIALYRQYQKTVKVITMPSGDEIEYIEADLVDIEYANKLAPEIFGRTLDELPPQTRRLLNVCKDLMRSKVNSNKSLDHGFTRREVRECIGWSEYQVRSHVKRLEAMEYIIRKTGRQGQQCQYELLVSLDDNNDEWDVGLVDVEALKKG